MIACEIRAEKRVSKGFSTLIPRLILLKDLTGMQKETVSGKGAGGENESGGGERERERDSQRQHT